jgi:hypothetical protein
MLRVIMRWYWGHISPGIYLAVEENPGKPQLGDR